MIRRDGHTHPNIMKKPHQGDEFVSAAIKAGFSEIVFTDHMPFTVTGDEHDRIPFGKVGEYVDFVGEFARKYEDKIKVTTGIEIDFHPSCVAEIKEVLSAGKFDTVLGSSHLNIKGFGVPFGKITRSEYAALVIENYTKAAESGLFDVLTHLDVYRFVFEEPQNYPLIDDGYEATRLERELRYLFSAMERGNVALEFNTAPLYKGFGQIGAYPCRDILKIAADYDLRYTYGSDAHTADKVGYGIDEFTLLSLKRK